MPCSLLWLTRARSSGVWGRFLKAVGMAGPLGAGSLAAACKQSAARASCDQDADDCRPGS